MNLSDIIVIGVLILIIGIIVGIMIYRKSKGKSINGCSGCDKCSAAGSCGKKQ